MKKVALLLGCSVALSACTALSRPGSLTLGPGQTGTLNGKTVTLLEVNDSRCPPGVRCVWAGELTATVKVNAQTMLLHWPERLNTPWAGLRITAATQKGEQASLKVTFSDQRPK